MSELCVALDMTRLEDAVALVEALGEDVEWYKVGPVLHVGHGESLIEALRERDKRIFLDLKWHDIPNTVAGAVLSASLMEIDLATVHLLGGRRMLKAAAEARSSAAIQGLRLVGVGILTSFTAQEFGDALGRPLTDGDDEQERLMRFGMEAGLDGFVCSASEVAAVRAFAGPDAFLVTPGIRRPGDGADDQSRTASPSDAVRAGSDLLVVGRPVTASADPAGAVAAILEEMAE